MKKFYLLLALTILFTGKNLYSQNDTLYAMKSGLIINKQSITRSNTDSITFYKPTNIINKKRPKGNSFAKGNLLSQNDTLYVMKAGKIINKQSIKTIDLDSIIFYKPSVDKPIVLNNNVKIIDKKSMILNLNPVQIANGIYQFTFSGATPIITSGDVIVGEDGEGYIRKVISSSVNSNSITLNTIQGSMSDVFSDGSFNFNMSLNGSSQEKIKLGDGFNYSINNLNLYQDGPLSIVLNNGYIDLNPNWYFKFDYSNSKVNYFEISARNGTLNGNFTATVTASQAVSLGEKSFSVLGKPYKKVFTKYVPALLLAIPVVVPIKVVIEIDVVATYAAAVNAAITRSANFISTNTFDLGAKFTNGQWEGINSFSPKNNFTFSNRTGNANVTIDLSLEPKIDVKLYGVTGPYSSIALKEQVSGSVASPSLDWDIKADVWLKSTMGINASIFSFDLFDYFKTWETTKLSYQTPYKIIKISGDNQKGVPGAKLIDPIKVKVVDSFDIVQSNVPVFFTVSTGVGSVETKRVLTDANGFAETFWTLGTTTDPQDLNVSVKKADGTHIIDSPVVFSTFSDKVGWYVGTYTLGKISSSGIYSSCGSQFGESGKFYIYIGDITKLNEFVVYHKSIIQGWPNFYSRSNLDNEGFNNPLSPNFYRTVNVQGWNKAFVPDPNITVNTLFSTFYLGYLTLSADQSKVSTKMLELSGYAAQDVPRDTGSTECRGDKLFVYNIISNANYVGKNPPSDLSATNLEKIDQLLKDRTLSIIIEE